LPIATLAISELPDPDVVAFAPGHPTVVGEIVVVVLSRIVGIYQYFAVLVVLQDLLDIVAGNFHVSAGSRRRQYLDSVEPGLLIQIDGLALPGKDFQGVASALDPSGFKASALTVTAHETWLKCPPADPDDSPVLLTILMLHFDSGPQHGRLVMSQTCPSSASAGMLKRASNAAGMILKRLVIGISTSLVERR
jgi:hypothetical protein